MEASASETLNLEKIELTDVYMTLASKELRKRTEELKTILSINNMPGSNPNALFQIGSLVNSIAGIDPQAGSKARELLHLAGKFYDADKWKRFSGGLEALRSRMSFEILNWLETHANILEKHGA